MYFIYTACFYLIPPTLGTEEEKDSLRKTRGAYQNVSACRILDGCCYGN